MGWEEGPVGRTLPPGYHHKAPPHPSPASPGLATAVLSALATREGIGLFPHSCVFWKPVILPSKASPVGSSHTHIVGIAASCQWLSLGFSFAYVVCEDWGWASGLYVHWVPTSLTITITLISPAIPECQRRWWQRKNRKSTWMRQPRPFDFSLPFCSAGCSALTHYTYPVGCSD